MVVLILNFEVIWYMCLSFSEELSLFFFFFFHFWKEIESYLLLDFCKDFSIVHGLFISIGSPVAYCNAGRQQGQRLMIWAHGKRGVWNWGLKICLFPLQLPITFPYVISYQGWTQTSWWKKKENWVWTGYISASTDLSKVSWSDSLQLPEETGVYFVFTFS